MIGPLPADLRYRVTTMQQKTRWGAVALLLTASAGVAAGWGDLIGQGLLQGAANAVGTAVGEAVSGDTGQDRAGQGESQSVGAMAGRSYAASEQGAGLSLDRIEALPAELPPLQVPLRADKPEVLRARARIAVPSYALSFLRTGDVSAHAAGQGSSIAQRSVRIKVVLAGLTDQDYRQLADEAYADLLQRLRRVGVEPITHAELSRLPGYGAVERVAGNMRSDAGHVTGRHEQQWTVYGASDAPLVKGMAMEDGLGAVAGAQAVLKLVDVGVDVDALIVQPLLVVDFVQMDSSGNSMFGGRASADARLLFSVHPRSHVAINYALKKGRGNLWGPLSLAQTVSSDEPFAVLRKVSENTDDQALYQGLLATGFGTMFKKSEGYVAQVASERYKGLVRAAYRGYNTAIAARIAEARDPAAVAANAAGAGEGANPLSGFFN